MLTLSEAQVIVERTPFIAPGGFWAEYRSIPKCSIGPAEYVALIHKGERVKQVESMRRYVVALLADWEAE